MFKEFRHGDAFISFGRSVKLLQNNKKYNLMCYFDVILLSDVISSINLRR